MEELLQEILWQQRIYSDLHHTFLILRDPALLDLSNEMRGRSSNLIYQVNQKLAHHRWDQTEQLRTHRWTQSNELGTHRWQQNNQLATMAWQLKDLLEKRGWSTDRKIREGFDKLARLIPEKQQKQFAAAAPATQNTEVLKNLDALKEQVTRLENLLAAKNRSTLPPALQPFMKLMLWLMVPALVLLVAVIAGGYSFYQKWEEDALAKDQQLELLQEQNVALSKQLQQYSDDTRNSIKTVKTEVETTKASLQTQIDDAKRQSRNQSWRLGEQVKSVELSLLESLMPSDTLQTDSIKTNQ